MSQNAAPETDVRVAACACGAVRLTTQGEPDIVNACACLSCQRRTGSSFTYTAFFSDAAVRIEGETRSWSEMRDAGRTHETFFCPTCGVPVFSRLQVFPGLTGVAVGCFMDPDFAAPHGFYWSSRRHRWLAAPQNMKVVDRQ